MKKRNLLIGFGALCITAFSAAGCKSGGPDVNPPIIDPEEDEDVVTSFDIKLNKNETDYYVSTSGGATHGEKGSVYVSNILPESAQKTAKFTYSSSDPDVLRIGVNGQFEVLKTGTATITVSSKTQPVVTKTVDITVKPIASSAGGGYNYQAKSAEEKALITGKLEGWAMDNHLTGITLFQNGGYVLYNPRLTLGTEEYIPGFGYGNLSNGVITKDAPLLDSNSTPEYKKYYHQVLTSSPANINYLNSQGEVIGDLYGYISAGLWNTKMNATKTNYEWYDCLAKSKPIPVDLDDATQLATTFEVKVKTGKDGLVYRTMSKKRNSFDKRPVELDDYVNAYVQLLTQGNKLSRGAELTNINSDGTLKGANAYYNLSSGGADRDLFDELVGLKTKGDDTLVFTLAKATTPFYAMYSLANSVAQPIPESFVKAIGGMQNYGSNGISDGSEVIDNILCLGPYMLEKFNNDGSAGSIIFKRNDEFIDRKSSDDSIKNRYEIPGIYAYVREGVSEQEILKYYTDGFIDATGVPQDKIDEYKSRPDCRQTQGDSTFKLNVNSSDEKEYKLHKEQVWEKKPAFKDYTVKPIMSNDHFLKGLNEAINRVEFAETIGAVPSQDYFGSSYLYDPAKGLAYNDSIYHQQNLATRYPATYGYNYDQAVRDFATAVEECVNDDKFALGESPERPTELTIDVHWMGPDDVKLYGNKLSKYIEKAFNDPEVSGNLVHLTVVNHEGTNQYEDVYNKHLQVGNFDLAFGSISGNALNPLNFLEVLKSDDSSGFTLNWGKDTSVVDGTLFYDGKSWSYDSLWTAANSGAIVGTDEKIVKEPIQYTVSEQDIKFNKADNSYDVLIRWNINTLLAGAKDMVNIHKGDISVFVLYAVSEKKMEYSAVIIPAKNITYTDTEIRFNIPYNPDKDGNGRPNEETTRSNNFLKGKTIRFQINYDVKIGNLTTTNFVEKEFTKPGNDYVKPASK